ncbi:MAG: type II CRISPR-associated endonuclease Cas1 [Phycisphaeraceae bacterium]|nr:type II CRISPR-associated endonuclease Cas1 [Phycisphaeraceae bacterium]
MIKRTVEISREPAHLAVRREQLLILRRADSDRRRRLPANPPNLAGTIPCEDLGVLMVDNRSTTYSHHALAKLAEHGAALVVCGRDHHPAGMFLPISSNTQLFSRLDAQLGASKPMRKRLWRQIVVAKLRAQAKALAPLDDPVVKRARRRILSLSRRIRSGDPENIEAQAASTYWPVIFAHCQSVRSPFRRRPGDANAPPPNNMLDYGYSAIRAAMARSIVSAGLLPALGIYHRGRSNPFCLADDLMEPIRPLIDRRVRGLAERWELELTQPVKAELLDVLTEEVECGELRGPLQVSLTRYVASLVRVLTRESDDLLIPESSRPE